MTLRNRLGLLFLSFLIVVTIFVVATAWAMHDQEQDALVINLAGRQRMLVQQIISRAVQIQAGSNRDGHQQSLLEAETIFDQTLTALIAGGDTQYVPGQRVSLPAARSDVIQAELRALQLRWNVFRADLRVIELAASDSASLDAALQSLQAHSPPLVQQADDVVRLYELESERKLARLRWMQGGFFLCTAGLLLIGVWTVRCAIMAPLQALENATKRIGQGDLGTPVQITGLAEFANLAASVDRMRTQLKISADGLEARVNQRIRELTALYDVICEISSRLEIEHVLNSVITKARDLIDSDVAFLCLLDETNESLVLKANDGPADAVCARCVLAKHSVAAQVLDRQEAMICDAGGCQAIAPNYRNSHLAAPLRVGDRVIGALCVGSTRTSTYSHKQVRLLTELANATAIALENARLYEQVERAAVLEERQRIAADMHDGLAQTLSYVKLKAGQLSALIAHESHGQAAQQLTLINDAVERAGHEVRQSIASLQAVLPMDRMLPEHLAEFVADFAQSAPEISVEVVSTDSHTVALESHVTSQVLGVVQEALQNARRHASATHILVRLEHHGPDYRVMIQDNGCGFDPTAMCGHGHFGLSIMQARASRIGGALTTESAPGCGTQVILTWPARRTVPG